MRASAVQVNRTTKNMDIGLTTPGSTLSCSELTGHREPSMMSNYGLHSLNCQITAEGLPPMSRYHSDVRRGGDNLPQANEAHLTPEEYI